MLKTTALNNHATVTTSEHLAWNDRVLEGLTAIGRITISVLRINEPMRVRHRLLLIEPGVFPPLFAPEKNVANQMPGERSDVSRPIPRATPR